MKRRREHGECENIVGGRGCLVFGTKACAYKKDKTIQILMNWTRMILKMARLYIVVGLIGIWLAYCQ